KMLYDAQVKSNNDNSCFAQMQWPEMGEAVSEYKTAFFFTMAYPWLFPGGFGDLNNRDRKIHLTIQEWASNLIAYVDGRFQIDETWVFVTLNMMYRRKNVGQSQFFTTTSTLNISMPSTLPELKDTIRAVDGDKFIKSLIYYSKTIRGTSSYWRSVKDKMHAWINFHITRGNGPPTIFMTLSCAEFFWPDLMKILMARHSIAFPHLETPNLHSNMAARVRVVNMFILEVQEFFQQKTKQFLDDVFPPLFGISQFFCRYEFTKTRGQIHCHLLAILKDKEPTKIIWKNKDDMFACSREVSDWASKKFSLRATHPATTHESNLNLAFVAPPEGTASVNKKVLSKWLFEVTNYDQDNIDLVNV
ncbi:MAG: hypothetical protein ACRDL7_13480, partial [Gaiellaceae bacterium]